MYFTTVCSNSYSFIQCESNVTVRVSPYHKTCCINAPNIVSFTVPLLVIARSFAGSLQPETSSQQPDERLILSCNVSVDVLPVLSDVRWNSLKNFCFFFVCHLDWCFACQACVDFVFDLGNSCALYNVQCTIP